MAKKKAASKGTTARSKVKPESDKLTAKERLFVVAYLRENFNATRAAIAAGYSERSAAELGYKLLQRPRVARAIAEAKARMLDDFGLSAERTLREIARIAYATVGDIVSWDAEGVVAWTPSASLTADQMAAIAEFSHTVTMVPSKDGGEPIERRQSKMKLHPKLNALVELLKWHKEQAEAGSDIGKPNQGGEAGGADAFARSILQELGEAPAGE